jgi:hypothetical protein
VTTVEQYSAGVVRTALRTSGFEVDGDQCPDVHHTIGGLAHHLGVHLTAIIAQRPPDGDFSTPDMVSTAVERLTSLFCFALQKLNARLVDVLTIQIAWTRPIRCGEAITGMHWLEEVCVEAATQLRAIRHLPISSRKLTKKRQRQGWTLDDVDIVTLIRQYFR